MTVAAQTLRHETAFAGVPGEAAALLEPLLLAAAGEGAGLLSVTVDYGPAGPPAGAVVAEAWVDRATRTLAFAHARLVTSEGTAVVTCSAVLRRVTEA